MALLLRHETPADFCEITRVNDAAFGQSQEGRLVEQLREHERYLSRLSLVARTDDRIVGHILFFPVDIVDEEGGQRYLSLSLAPMSVLPEYQNQGIGTELVVQGLDAAAGLGFTSVVVLGHPWYYPRFGFEPASRFGISSPWEGLPDEAFLALELEPGSLEEVRGVVEYPQEFFDL